MRRACGHQEDRLLGCVIPCIRLAQLLANGMVQFADLLLHPCPFALLTLRAGGGNDYRLGSGGTVDQLTPGLIADGGGYTYRAVACGTSHACALRTDGTAVCWGWNDNGQCGCASAYYATTPSNVAGSHQFKRIAAGYRHTCGVTTAGVAMCWGECSG